MKPKLKLLCRFSLAFLFLFLVSLKAIASSIGISHFYDTDYLSSNLITSICQDKQGYIWVSTEYGLNRFDGVHFTSYYANDDTQEPLQNNNCRKVICDNDGRVWVISYSSVQYYDRLHNRFHSLNIDRDHTSYPTDLIVLADGRLVMLTTSGGLYFVNPTDMSVAPWTEANKLYTDSTALNAFVDSRDRIWICSDRKGVTGVDVKAGKIHHFDRSLLKSDGTNAVCEDEKGRIIILSRAEVLLFDESANTLRKIGNTNELYLRGLFRTHQGKVLLSTYGKGLFEVDIDNDRLTPTLHETVDGISLGSQSVQWYMEDKQGNKWIGCLKSGLAFISDKHQPFSYFNIHSLPNDNGGVISLLKYDDGHLYVGQENSGITEFTLEGQTLSHRFSDEYILAMQKDRSGNLWLGTYGRGARIVKAGTQTITKIDSLYGKRVKDFAIDKSGNVYLAVFDYGLLIAHTDGTWQHLSGQSEPKLHNRYLNKLFFDSKGWLWIGHYNGLDVYDPQSGSMIDIPVDSILRPAHTFAITETHDGMICLGTNKGLFCYNKQNQSWKLYDKHDGLANEIVCGVVEDDQGDLWISTYRGLSYLQRKTGEILNYYKGNGLESSSYARGLYGKLPDGRVFFGNDHGFTYFSPSEIPGLDFPNGITLTGLFLAGKEIGTDGEHVRLDYQNNTFTLRFSTMDYREAGSLQYEYRFDDENNDVWHRLPPGVSDIILSHLRFGKHLLEVRVQDNGIYSPVKQIAIEITPPWYRSWWAYFLYALMATGVIIMVFLNIRHKQQADVNEEKIKFFVDISHELRSPLTLIKSPLDKLLIATHDPTETRALRNMKRNTDRMLTLVNQILSIRKIEKGQMKLHFAETDLGEFVDDICHDFDFQTESRKINLTFTCPEKPIKVWIDRDNFDKVVANLISNALKYVEDEGTVKVAVGDPDNGRVELSVTDNGAGIDEALLKKVFERFYQTSARPSAGQMGYGIGLNLTQKLTRLHGGTITARNRTDGQGSVFTVSLPLGNTHLPQAQLVDNDYFSSESKADNKQIENKSQETEKKVRKRTNYKIAVVDDDKEIRDFLSTELGDVYSVTTYPDGRQALTGIIDTQPDLVISDVVMPEMDGMLLLKRIKSGSKTSHIPVILLTTKTEHQSLIKGLEEGADAYMDKPFNLEELEARIASLIANRVRLKGKFTGEQEQEDNLRQIELKGINEELMQRIMKVVNERLDDSDLNVEALAEAVGVSRSQLHRRVKEITGISVGEFMRNLRLQQAARLLEKGDTTIAQVTYATGFSNPTHFSAAFKRAFGISPSEYMNKHSRDTK